MSTKKILFTSHTANFQKFNRPFMRMLKGSLDEQYSDFNIGGWDVDYASANEEKILDADNVFAVDFPRNPFRIPQLIRSYKQVKKIIESTHYDLIHTHTPVGSVVTRLAARKARKNGTKVLYTAHGFHFYKGAPLKNWLLWYPVEKHLAKDCDYLITINTEDYKLAKSKFKTKVRFINGVGINTEKFNKKLSKEEKNKLRKSLGLSLNDYVVVFNGEFNPDKNHRMLLKGIAPLLTSHGNMKVILISKGLLLDDCRQLTKDLNISKQVLFLGYRNDVSDILQICDLYVSPSKREGLVISVLEAIYSQLPVILFDNRGHRQILGKYTDNLFTTEVQMREMIEKQFSGKKDYSVPFNEDFSLKSALEAMRKIYIEATK